MPDNGSLLPALLGAVPPALAFIGNLYWSGSDSLTARRIEKDSKLLEAVPQSCKAPLEALIVSEVDDHIRRRKRKIDWTSLGALVLVVVVVSAMGYGLAWLALNWAWGVWLAFVPWTAFGSALALVGFSHLFKYPDANGDYPTRQRTRRQG